MGKGAEPKEHRGAAFWGQRLQPCGCGPGHMGPPCRQDSAPGTAHSGTSAWRREGPGCVFPSVGEGVRLGALPRWAGLDAWREKRKHLSPCRALDAGLCCVKAVGGSFRVPSRQSPCPFAEMGLCALGRLSRCFAPDLTNSGTLIVPSGIWGQLKRRGNMAAVQKLYIVIKPEERICVA